MPKVVNIKQTCLTRNGYENFCHWNSKENHIYIGRGNELMPPSKWMNPFKIGNDNRQQCTAKYEEMIRNDDELINCLHELNNCVPGCHCFPQDCHGQVLQKLFTEKFIKNENPKHNNEIHNDVKNKKQSNENASQNNNTNSSRDNASLIDDNNKISVKISNFYIRKLNINKINDDLWFDDELINSCLHLIMSRSQDKDLPSTFAFNTHFVPMLLRDDNESRIFNFVKENVQLFYYDILLFPIHSPNHWSLITINMDRRTIIASRFFKSQP